jgi:hypothetical protein
VFFCNDCNLNEAALSASRTVKVPMDTSEEHVCFCKIKACARLAEQGIQWSCDETEQWYIGPVDD